MNAGFNIATSRPAENALHNAVGNNKHESRRALLSKGCNRYGTDMARDLQTWQRTMLYGSLRGAFLPQAIGRYQPAAVRSLWRDSVALPGIRLKYQEVIK